MVSVSFSLLSLTPPQNPPFTHFGAGLPGADVKVTDISGGCGSMYDVQVTSDLFKGVSKVKQSRMVQDLIKKEIGDMHGLTLKTKTPK